MPRPCNRVAVLGAAALVLICALSPAVARTQDPVLQWSDLYDGGAGQHDEGIVALFAQDGHPIVGGVRTAASGRLQILIRKLDRSDASPLWTHVFGDPDGNDLFMADMVLDHRGDLLVAGYLAACDG